MSTAAVEDGDGFEIIATMVPKTAAAKINNAVGVAELNRVISLLGQNKPRAALDNLVEAMHLICDEHDLTPYLG